MIHKHPANRAERLLINEKKKRVRKSEDIEDIDGKLERLDSSVSLSNESVEKH